MLLPFPLLVESLIDWYRWQIKWREVNKMYHSEYIYSSGWNCMYLKSNMMQYNYRSLSYDRYIYIFNYRSIIVLKCPSRYYQYSSGMSHPFGYKIFD